MATRQELEALITREATAAGLNPADFIRMAEIESSFNPNAGAKTSSAKGLFQFIDSTAKRYGLQDVYDPVESTRAAIRLAKDNIKATGASTGADMYMAHQWGADGYNKMRKADPNAPVESVLGKDAAKNNAMAGMTVAQGLDFWRNKFNRGSGATQDPMQALLASQPNVPAVQDGQNLLVPTTQPEADMFGKVVQAAIPDAAKTMWAKAASMVAGAQAALKDTGSIFDGVASTQSPIDDDIMALIESA